MDVNKALQFADNVVFEKTGKHLDDLQRAVVEGTWQRQTYEDIAENCNVTKNYVSDVGSKLWQLLSEALDEDIKKSNFRSNLERISIESSQNPNVCIGTNNYFNFSSPIINQPNKQSQESDTNTTSKIYHDLNLAPQIIKFYNRETELETLADWILNQNIRLISVLGLSGIGKMTLVKRFVDLNSDKFEVIIWRSLKFPKFLELLLDDLLTICNQEPKQTIDDKLNQLFTILTEKKSLIILDDVQNIFIPGEFAGQYQTEYQDYQNLFKMITEIQHQSSVILISQEQCAEMHCLDEELYPIKCLELSGLNDTKILENTGLTNQDNWSELIELYEGNPGYLKDIAYLIRDVFDGDVSDFLAEDNLIITKTMQSRLKKSLARLSTIEKNIVLQLSKFEQPVSRQELKETLDLSSTEFINGLCSLQQRYLLTKIKTEKFLFKLSPIFRQIATTYLD